jgi:adenylyltransferase/sulfurtransferase
VTGGVAHPDPGSRGDQTSHHTVRAGNGGADAGRGAELSRWHRQEILPWFGADAQARLRRAHAVVVGCGALGCAQADLLARAGVGRLTLIDRDVVEWTNLQRQSLYVEDDARRGVAKAAAAAARVRAIDSSISVRECVADLVPENALECIGDADVIVDGLDGFETRYILNDVAVSRGVPYVYCGVVAARGMTMPVVPAAAGAAAAPDVAGAAGAGPCLRCVFDEPPAAGVEPTCDTAGVFGPAVAVVAGLAAANAIRLLAGLHAQVDRSLVSFDLAGGARGAAGPFTRISLDGARRSDCVCCGTRRFEWLMGMRASDATALCGRNAVQVKPVRSGSSGATGSLAVRAGAATSGAPDSLDALAGRLRELGEVRVERGVVHAMPRGERSRTGEPIELAVFADGRTIVRGTSDIDEARRIHARLVGS